MSCSYCGEKIFARGLCQKCYWRQRRNGSVERKNVKNTGICSVEGCGKHSFAKGMCQTHYNKAAHPLKNTWKLIRSRWRGEFPESWDSFDTFIADVGARPSPKHQLRRRDDTQPYSKDNVLWIEPIGSDFRKGRWSPGKIASYDRVWNLKRKYGISLEEYNALLAAQNGVCAICGKMESHIHKSGKLKELAVDHCHKTKKVRGLLCFNCNQALGRFQDSMENLRRALAYLEKHSV